MKLSKEIDKELFLQKGVYKITNLIDNNIYIGSTIQGFKFRFGKMICSYNDYLKGKRKMHPLLFDAFDTFDIDNFEFSIVEIVSDLSKIREREEFYITELQSQYNYCKYPTKGGSPNLNRKLTFEWKRKIQDKSKLYKHSEEVLQKVSNNNKNNSCNITFTKDDEILNFNSWVEVASYFGIKNATGIIGHYKKSKLYKGYTIIQNSKQMKGIRVFLENEILEFDSFNNCDKHFNMWRGYTSTKTLRNEPILDKYNYEIIKI